MSEKITESELISILENPTGEEEELEKVQECIIFELTQNDSQPSVQTTPVEKPKRERLSQKFQINADAVELSENERQSEFNFEKVHEFFKRWRQKRYDRIVNPSKITKVIKKPQPPRNFIKIVSEGDSWFQYPLILDDIVDQIFEPKKIRNRDKPYVIYSLDHAGARLDEIIEEDEFVDAIKKIRPTYFMIGGGGNDLLDGGDGIQELIFDSSKNDEPEPGIKYAEKYINLPKLKQKIEDVMSLYKKVFDKVLNEDAFEGTILCHGYDYVKPIKGGKILGERLVKKGIVNETIMADVLAYIIDRFNEALINTIEDQPPGRKGRIVHVDCRGAAGPKDWNWYRGERRERGKDDFHPSNTGFKKIAKRFLNKLEELENERGN